jgi:hypothetical protein
MDEIVVQILKREVIHSKDAHELCTSTSLSSPG